MDRTRTPARTAPTALMIALLAWPGPLAAATAPDPDAYRQELESWWAELEASLRSPDGWLTLTGLHWLQEGENRFGSAADNEIVFPAGRALARAGVLRLAGGNVTLEAAPGAGIVYDGKPVTTPVELAVAKGRPVLVELGSLRFHLIDRGGRLGVRARDREHPVLAAFTGVKRFPVDPTWRIEARFEPYDPPKQIQVPNVLGVVTEGPSYGAVVFEREGRTWRLDALDGQSGTPLSLIFGDGTNGEETYGGGRFLETERESGGKVVVDFNKAYSPPCAYTAFATCPLPPRQNKIALRVTAGEKRYFDDDHAAPAAAQTTPPPAAAPAAPPAPPSASADPRANFEAWRQEREKGLRNPDGWLTLVGLHWLEEGANPIGSGEENHIVFPAGKAPARAGVLRLAKGQVTLEAPAEAGITIDGKPVTTLALASDKESKPTILELGSLRFHVIDRGGRLGLRVRDRESPVLAAFHGVDSYPFDPSWRVEARLERYDPPKKVPVPNVLGTVDDEDSPAAVVFERDGRTYRLDGLEGGDKGELFLIFGDATNGETTYGGGRFLVTEAPAGDTVVVDFNKAYNPPCAFTPYATCPLPPRQNKLGVAVAAGEKSFGEGH